MGLGRTTLCYPLLSYPCRTPYLCIRCCDDAVFTHIATSYQWESNIESHVIAVEVVVVVTEMEVVLYRYNAAKRRLCMAALRHVYRFTPGRSCITWHLDWTSRISGLLILEVMLVLVFFDLPSSPVAQLWEVDTDLNVSVWWISHLFGSNFHV